MTRLGHVMREQNATYSAVAERARLQPRTIRQLATGETPMDNVSIGTVRKIATALAVPIASLLEDDPVHPGDASRPRSERLSEAIRANMWSQQPVPYVSPVEAGARDDIADVAPDDFFADMTPIDARRG
ncbi:MAG: helix-turn-helix transcriptional regulator [Chloroflexota bacterium]